MAGALGVSSFVSGMIPLAATFSSTSFPTIIISSFNIQGHIIERLLDTFNALATGLLLGTALGVIIPEYVAIIPEPGRSLKSWYENQGHRDSRATLQLGIGIPHISYSN
jgi:hypothetical protein